MHFLPIVPFSQLLTHCLGLITIDALGSYSTTLQAVRCDAIIYIDTRALYTSTSTAVM